MCKNCRAVSKAASLLNAITLSPNVANHRRRASDVQNEIEGSSRRSVHLSCWAKASSDVMFSIKTVGHGCEHQTNKTDKQCVAAINHRNDDPENDARIARTI